MVAQELVELLARVRSSLVTPESAVGFKADTLLMIKFRDTIPLIQNRPTS